MLPWGIRRFSWDNRHCLVRLAICLQLLRIVRFSTVHPFSSLWQRYCHGKRSIVISSPRLYRVTNNKLVSLLKEQSANGVEVAIVTAINDEQYEFLQSTGLLITNKPKLRLCTIIIDKSLVWYGSVNALGYNSDKDNIIKMKDKN